MKIMKRLMDSLGVIVLLIGIITFIAALVALFHIIIGGNSFSNNIDATQTKIVNIYGIRGKKVEFTIKAGRSIAGLWASTEGLTLELNSLRKPSQLINANISPKEKSWKDSLYVNTSYSSESPIVISGSFIIPSNLDQEVLILQGELHGSITYPDTYGSGSFINRTIYISTPVLLNVISESEMQKLEQSSAIKDFIIYISIFIICIIFMFISAKLS